MGQSLSAVYAIVKLHDSSRVALSFERLAELFQEKLHIVLGRQRTHNANAKHFPCKRTKAAGNLNSRIIEQALSHFRLVDAFGDAHRIQSGDSVFFRNVKAQAHGLYAFDERLDGNGDAAPSDFQFLPRR